MENDKLILRLLDVDNGRLMEAERLLRRHLAEYGVDAEVHTVSCFLEISRHGLSGREPALQAGGCTVSAGCPLTDEFLAEVCRKLAGWQAEKISAAKSRAEPPVP